MTDAASTLKASSDFLLRNLCSKTTACAYAAYQIRDVCACVCLCVRCGGMGVGEDYIYHLEFEFYSKFQLYIVDYSQCVQFNGIARLLSMNLMIYFHPKTDYIHIYRVLVRQWGSADGGIGAVYAFALVTLSNCCNTLISTAPRQLQT